MMALVSIDGFVIDCTLSEEHVSECDVTEWPVESGIDITDDVRAKSKMLTLEGLVSDTPIGEAAADPSRLPAGARPTQSIVTKLDALQAAREPFPVVTSVRVYPTVVIQSLTIPRDAQTGEAIKFRATFKEIRIVTNERTTVKTEHPRAKKKRKLGHKATSLSSTGTVQEARPRSHAVQILDAILPGGFSGA